MQKGSDNARLVLQTKAACQQFTVRRSRMGSSFHQQPTGSAEICKRDCPPSQSSSPSIGSTNQRSKLHLSSTGRTSEYVLSTNFLDSRCPFLSWCWNVVPLFSRSMKRLNSPASLQDLENLLVSARASSPDIVV